MGMANGYAKEQKSSLLRLCFVYSSNLNKEGDMQSLMHRSSKMYLLFSQHTCEISWPISDSCSLKLFLFSFKATEIQPLVLLARRTANSETMQNTNSETKSKALTPIF
ncbi:hypothetical protein O6H91_06G146600 [Diphasiastrum complanatum]|uniref:Uncharacterized protein n=1 Tax=Diphasiastrum complanatum TaxID=34168 RepID=A0ACC2DJU4_DIPCM|nr:hypothetical protein O6H91_06G146600 [Diphasiastrum complanatum]